MKKIILLASILGTGISSFGQHHVKQYFFVSGGNYGNSGNKAKVGIIKNGTVSYIDSILGDFTNTTITFNKSTTLTEGLAHIGRGSSGNDLVVRYDLDTYERKDSVKSSGVQAIAYNGNKMVIAKGYGTVGDYVDIHDGTSLAKIASIPSIKNECTDVKIIGDSAYISHSQKGIQNPCAGFGYNCASDTLGFISILNLRDNSISNTIELGTKGAGAKNLILRKEADSRLHIYFSNGKDSLFKFTPNASVHSLPYSYTLAVTDGYIFGLKNTSPKLTATTVNKYQNNYSEVLAIDSKGDFNYSFPVAYDTVNNLYLIARNTFSKGQIIFFDAAKGKATDSVSTGLYTTAFVPDYRQGVLLAFNNHNESSISASAFPNPCKDVLTIQNAGNASSWSIQSKIGQTIASGILTENVEKINTEELAKDVYFLVLAGNGTQKTIKFVKE